MKKKPMSAVEALGWSLLLCVILGGLGTLFAYTPYFQGTPILGLIIVWTLAIATGVASFWNGRSPNWVADGVVMFCLATLFLASAIHALSLFFSGWLWIVLLSSVYFLAWVLPVLNLRLATYLYDAQYKIGRNLALILIFLTLLISVILTFPFSRITVPFGWVMLFIGIISACLAVGFAQTFAYQIWCNRRRANQVQIPEKTF